MAASVALGPDVPQDEEEGDPLLVIEVARVAGLFDQMGHGGAAGHDLLHRSVGQGGDDSGDRAELEALRFGQARAFGWATVFNEPQKGGGRNPNHGPDMIPRRGYGSAGVVEKARALPGGRQARESFNRGRELVSLTRRTHLNHCMAFRPRIQFGYRQGDGAIAPNFSRQGFPVNAGSTRVAAGPIS